MTGGLQAIRARESITLGQHLRASGNGLLTCGFSQPQARAPHLFEQPDRLHDSIKADGGRNRQRLASTIGGSGGNSTRGRGVYALIKLKNSAASTWRTLKRCSAIRMTLSL
jgi:hypothetical protein